MNKCLLGLCMLATAPPVPTFVPPPNAPVREHFVLQDPAVAQIEVETPGRVSYCTAFVVKKDVLVTAKHCVRPGATISVYYQLPIPPVLVMQHAVASNDGEDWAILVGETPAAVKPFTVEAKLPEWTAHLYSVGFPISHTTPPTINVQYIARGRFLAYDAKRHGILMYLPLYPGESGGPILDVAGHVVGIISAIVLYDDKMTPVTVASPSAHWVEAIP